MNADLVLLAIGFPYAIVASYFAYRESGRKWMLFLPHWIGSTSGVSARLRRHGAAAFAILFVGAAMFLY